MISPADSDFSPSSSAARLARVGAHVWPYAAPLPDWDATPALPNAFAEIKHAGFDGVELMGPNLLHDDAVERISALIEQHELPVLGVTFGRAMWDRSKHAAIFADAEKLTSRLAKIGGRNFAVSVGQKPEAKIAAEYDAQAEMVVRLTDLAADHGLALNLHNHTYEVENGERDLSETLARVPDAKLGPDLNWLVRAGGDPVDFIRRHRDRIVFVHLRDQGADGRWTEALGEGAIDHAAIAAELNAIQFDQLMVVELAYEKDFVFTRTLEENLRLSREFVRSTFGR